MMKFLVLATMLAMTAGMAVADHTTSDVARITGRTVTGEVPDLSHVNVSIFLIQPYKLRYADGERRLLVYKSWPGVETLTRLMVNSNEFIVERNDPQSITFVYRPDE
jgi:hypothetical protein